MTNINDFDPSLLSIDEVLFKSNKLIMYDIKYIKNLNSSFIEKSGESRYLIFASTQKNKTMMENCIEPWDEIKEQTELITDHKVTNYSKDFLKIRFKTNDDLPLSKIINIPVCVVIVSSIFKEDNEYHPQVLLHDCFYEYEEHVNPLVVN